MWITSTCQKRLKILLTHFGNLANTRRDEALFYLMGKSCFDYRPLQKIPKITRISLVLNRR